MNCDSNETNGKSPVTPSQALAMKNAALRAMLGYLEYKNGPGEWFKDELAYRFHRMVELALEAPCDLHIKEPNRSLALDQPSKTEPDNRTTTHETHSPPPRIQIR